MDDCCSGGELPRFHICNLKDSGLSPDTNPESKKQDPSVEVKPHAFKMRKASYDKLVTDLPHAVLSYDDVDDHEKITVGSGLELEQRLQEPADVAKRSRLGVFRTDAMHSFDIASSEEAHQTWGLRSLHERQRDPQAASAQSDFSREADRLKQELQDRIGKLSAQVKTTTLDKAPQDPDASDKVSVTATAGESSPRVEYYQRSNPPTLLPPSYRNLPNPHQPQFSPYHPLTTVRNSFAEPPAMKHPEATSTLTPQGTWMAQQAAAAMTPSCPCKSGFQTIRSEEHANRWASYGNSRGFPKQPPVELSSSIHAPRVELDTHNPDGQPLLQMFQAELAKISNSNPAPSDTTNKSSGGSSAANKHEQVDIPATSAQRSGDATSEALRALFQGIGELAVQTLSSNPKLGQNIAAAGNGLQSNLHAAFNAGVEAVRSINTSAGPVSQPDNNVVLSNYLLTDKKASISGHGEMVWHPYYSLDQHDLFCTAGCRTRNADCPIRQIVGNLRSYLELPLEASFVQKAKLRRQPTRFHADKKAVIGGQGELVWVSTSKPEQHGFYCLPRCQTQSSTCPVHHIVEKLVQGMDISSEQAVPELKYKFDTSPSARAGSTSHHSTQTDLKDIKDASDNDDERTAFEADRILAKRYISYNTMWGPTKVQYLVRWVGHGPEHDVWYDAENLGGCKGLVEMYERALRKKGAGPVQVAELGRDELHAIHLRTAGDRMVASRKWEESEELLNHRRFHTDESYLQSQLKDVRDAQVGESKKGKDLPVEPDRNASSVEARSSSLDTKPRATPSAGIAASTLRHRKSWHPSLNPTPLHRAVSPTAAAEEKYPAISSFEAAHHGVRDNRRKSVPDFKQSSLDFPYVEQSRRSWLGLDAIRGPAARDKSVRFDLKDPWVEKKLAQASWDSKQKEHESLFGVSDPPSTSSKKEGKKPLRYSSPPPPKPAFEPPVPEPLPNDEPGPSNAPESSPFKPAKKEDSSGDIWRELTNNASLKRARSLNLPTRVSPHRPLAPFAQSPLRFSSSHESKDKTVGPESGKWKEFFDSVETNESVGPIRPKRDPATLRRAASARFNPQSRGSAWASKRQSMPSQAGRSFARSSIVPTTPTHLPMTFDDLLGANPWIQDYRAPSTGDGPGDWTYDESKDSSVLKYPAMTPSKPATSTPVTQPTTPATANTSVTVRKNVYVRPASPQPTLTRQPSQLREVPPAVRARNEAIKMAVDNLVKLGYEGAQAKFVAESVDGNLDEALDMLQEDMQARHEGFETDEEKEKEQERRMPGAF